MLAPPDQAGPSYTPAPWRAKRARLAQHAGPGTSPVNRFAVIAIACALATGIFLFDTLATVDGAVAVLYVIVVFIAARSDRTRDLAIATGACLALTGLSFVLTHGVLKADASTLRVFVSLSAIAIAAFLALQNQTATKTLTKQAQLLELSHDMIFAREPTGAITYWNRAAADGYGWSKDEALGRNADQLLRTIYAEPKSDIEAELLRSGRWDGELTQRTKDGATLELASRWAVQTDRRGVPVAILETHTDISERKKAHASLVQSERRFRRMFEASRVGVLQQDWSRVRAALDELAASGIADVQGHAQANPAFLKRLRSLARIVDVNPVALRMAGMDDAPHVLTAVDDILCELDQTFPSALAAFERGDAFFEGETTIRTVDGGRTPILFSITFPDASDPRDSVLVFMVDITERNQAQRAILAAQAELAHAARVSTLGELTASIAHEVNQPLTAIVTSGEAALRWLRRKEPELSEVEMAVARAVAEGKRASQIVHRIRSFLTKAPGRRSALDVSELLSEAVQLVEREVQKHGVVLRSEVAAGLPPVVGDQIALQQVVVNLLVNGSQAMAGQRGARELTLRALRDGEDRILVEVGDAGPGIAEADLDRLFQPFFTTKEDGMGMGLAICRSTIESHGGRLWAENTAGAGATFRFTLPVARGEEAV
jgi:PAS domain S-box-containing protein